jgi:hypothetical protein
MIATGRGRGLALGIRPFLERLRIVLAVVPLVAGGAPVARAVPEHPLLVGQWSHPFEEGGAETPRCHRLADGSMLCKPTAVEMASLPDGRVLYVNGIEGDENIRFGYVPELGTRSRADRARVMDLSGPEPIWMIPSPEDGGAGNPQIRPGANDFNDDPFGTVGAPGRPGDGFVGSTWGQLGGPPQEPTSPPDDTGRSEGTLFCADFTQLGDGRILIAGGTDYYNEPAVMDRDDGDPADIGVVELEGIRSARIFDWRTNSFTQAAHMRYGRWYPAMVTLSDGKVLIASGVTKLVRATQLSQVRRTETYDPDTDTWSANYTGPESEASLPLNPRLHLMPNGKVLYNGVGQMWGTLGYAVDEATFGLQKLFDPQTKLWETLGLAMLGTRSVASEVMLPLEPPYEEATLLTFGGALGPPPSHGLGTTLSTLTTLTREGGITTRLTPGQLHNRRWFPSGVLLPDGQVLAVNGGDKDSLLFPGYEVPVHQAELFDPQSGTWTPMASASRDRVYHHSAMLLPDGRVLAGGNVPPPPMYGSHRDQGGPFANNDKDSSFEIFSPPYLFRGQRPSITHAPAAVAWGSSFPLRVTGADQIHSVVLIRTPSPQHGVDSDQRAVELKFTRAGDVVTAAAPPGGSIAPPGFYYLFVNRSSPSGPVPSVARIVKLGSTSDPAPALQPMLDSTGAAGRTSATSTEDSQMNDVGGCAGCRDEERGGMVAETGKRVSSLAPRRRL